MTQPPMRPDGVSEGIQDNFQRIHQLGSATSQLFSRLYQGLRRPSPSSAEDTDRMSPMQIEYQHEQLRQRVIAQEAEIERLNSILAGLNDGIIMQDMEGRIVMMNQTARDLLGSQKHFWQSELGTWFNNFRHIMTATTELEVMDRARRFRVGDKVLGAQLAVVADSSGLRLGSLIMLRDVTRDTLTERLKDSVITSISHELKTPMNVMRIASEILLSQPEDAPANRKMLEKLSRNIDILDRMVIELLDVSEMSSGSFAIQRESVYIETLLWDVISSFHQEIAKAKLEARLMLRDADQLTLLGDKARLKWALGHLLRNSLAYTPAGGTIKVTARYLSEADQILIIITDSGVGIAPKDLPHVFELFYRGEARTATGKRLDPRGLGQGLFIARRVAEAHGGFVGVESELYQGSQFAMTLPAVRLPVLAALTPQNGA